MKETAKRALVIGLGLFIFWTPGATFASSDQLPCRLKDGTRFQENDLLVNSRGRHVRVLGQMLDGDILAVDEKTSEPIRVPITEVKSWSRSRSTNACKAFFK